MKRLLFLLILASCTSHSDPEPLSDVDKISFQRGYSFGERSLHTKGMPYNLEQIILGIRAAEKGANPLLSEEEFYSLIHKFQDEALAIQTEDNLREAELFLKSIALKEGAVELIKNKLYFEIANQGKGDPLPPHTPLLASYITRVLHHHRLEMIFQSERSPMEICLEDTIPGFAQGVEGMLTEEKRVIYIHPDLAYGAAAAKVEPNQLIVIEVTRAH